MIAIPCMDSVPVEFAQSLRTLRKVGDVAVSFLPNSLIYDARNRLSQQAIEGGFDYVLWLDSDMVFGADTMERLFEDIKDKDFVSGLYFLRRPPFEPVLYGEYSTKDDGRIHYEKIKEYPEEIFEIGACGFGCVLMRTEMLINVALQERDFFSPILGIGEDLSFCYRANRCGYKMYCDPQIKCGHVGKTVITEEIYKAIKEQK